MKKHTLFSTLTFAALLASGWAYAQSPTPSPTITENRECRTSSWNPELYTFYGTRDAIIEKLASIPVKPSERRVFVQLTQGDSGINVRLYEQQKNNKFTVTEWTGKQVPGLQPDIDAAIIANKGVNCVGEQVKKVLLDELHQGKVKEEVPAPASPEAAFAHPVKDATGDFVKTTIIVLC
jgi:hypothetical protein